MTTLKQIISIDKFLRKRRIAKFAKILTMLWEKKAENVVAIDLSKFYSYADFIVICTGNSTKHTQSIADALYEKAKELKKGVFIEGYNDGTWILLDFGTIIIHVFTEEKRELYDLESLWFDAPIYTIEERPNKADV